MLYNERIPPNLWIPQPAPLHTSIIKPHNGQQSLQALTLTSALLRPANPLQRLKAQGAVTTSTLAITHINCSATE